MDLKGEIDSNTIIEADLNTSLISIGEKNRKSARKNRTHPDTRENVHRNYLPIFLPIDKYIFFSLAHGDFSRTGHVTTHKTCFGKLKSSQNYTMHLLRPSWSGARDQEIKTPKKACKHMKTE